MKPTNLKIPQLTFSRFLAAIAIVIFHFRSTVYPFSIEGIHVFTGYLNVLVSYFFVLSGFILVVNTSEKLSIKKFYLNRFSRIYPLYLFALLFTLLLILNARTPKDSIQFDKVFCSLFLVQAWSGKYALTYNFPAWSLSVEAFFYLLFPFIYNLMKRMDLRWQLVCAAAFWAVMQCQYIYMVLKGEHFVFYHPIYHLSTFVTGMAAGSFFRERYLLLQKKIAFIEIASSAGILFIGYLIYTKNAFFYMVYQNGTLAPLFVLFIYTIACSKRFPFDFFSNRKLEYLGEISYGIYILQIPMSIFVFGIIDRLVNIPPTISFYIYVLVLLVFSSLTFELIEKPSRIFLRNKIARLWQSKTVS